MATAVGVEHDGGQLRAVPLSVLLDLGGLEVEARKNILRALNDSHAREMQLRAEVQRLRQWLKPERADVHPLPASA
jgi:hypothetical protein